MIEDGTIVKESVDLFQSDKSKSEINALLERYNVKASPKVSPDGHCYQEICGEYSNMLCFLTEVYDMQVCEVMSNACFEVVK